MGGQVKAWEAEVPDLGQGKPSIQGRLGDRQGGLGFGRFAVTVEQVFDEERRVFGRGARLLGCLGHRCGCGLSSEDHQNSSESRNEHKVHLHTNDVLAIKSVLFFFLSWRFDLSYTSDSSLQARKNQSKKQTRGGKTCRLQTRRGLIPQSVFAGASDARLMMK